MLTRFGDGQRMPALDPSQALINVRGASRRLAIIEWLTFVSTELHKTFGPPEAAAVP